MCKYTHTNREREIDIFHCSKILYKKINYVQPTGVTTFPVCNSTFSTLIFPRHSTIIIAISRSSAIATFPVILENILQALNYFFFDISSIQTHSFKKKEKREKKSYQSW